MLTSSDDHLLIISEHLSVVSHCSSTRSVSLFLALSFRECTSVALEAAAQMQQGFEHVFEVICSAQPHRHLQSFLSADAAAVE